jgi:hypothetical protein
VGWESAKAKARAINQFRNSDVQLPGATWPARRRGRRRSASLWAGVRPGCTKRRRKVARCGRCVRISSPALVFERQLSCRAPEAAGPCPARPFCAPFRPSRPPQRFPKSCRPFLKAAASALSCSTCAGFSLATEPTGNGLPLRAKTRFAPISTCSFSGWRHARTRPSCEALAMPSGAARGFLSDWPVTSMRPAVLVAATPVGTQPFGLGALRHQ